MYLYDMAQFGNITSSGKAKISSPFGRRNIGPGKSKNHKGIDISYPSGTQITSPLDGVIEKASQNAGNCGGLILINHGTFNGKNVKTKYCHVKKLDVNKGDQVKKGEIVGLSGGGKNDVGRGNSTGAHIHFEVLENGTQVDPAPYYKNSISGEQSDIEISTNGEDNGSENNDSGSTNYKDVAKNLIKKLFGLGNEEQVKPEVVNEIVNELYRYKELINEQVMVLDNSSQSNTNGGTMYVSYNLNSDIRVLPTGGKVEVLSDKLGYQNAIRVGGMYDYYWNGSMNNIVNSSISTGTVIGKTSDGRVFIKSAPKTGPIDKQKSGDTSKTTTNTQTSKSTTTPTTTTSTNDYRTKAEALVKTLFQGKQQNESVKSEYEKILEEELKTFKRLIN